MTALDVALNYIGRGWNPVPVPFREKKPPGNRWQKRVIDAAAAANYFNSSPMNIGVMLGATSKNLVDADLDCAEAVVIGSYILPRTGSIFGRASKRNSHMLYTSDLADKPVAAFQFRNPRTQDMLLELRVGGGGKGAQSIFPGSTHKETGEPILWESDGTVATVDGADLLRRVRELAAYCLIARHWPGNGSRHHGALVIGGFLARTGKKATEIGLIMEGIGQAVTDEEWSDRRTAAKDAVAALAAGKSVYGFPALAELIGGDIAAKVAEWLDYQPDAGAATGPETECSGAGISLDDFYAYMLQSGAFIFAPSREIWPAANVNARLKAPVAGLSASTWLVRNRPVEQASWVPGSPLLIKDRLISHGGWIKRPGVTVFNLYLPPNITPKAGDVTPWLSLLEKVFPDQAAHIALWLAHRVQRPHEKINHALVLGGEPGIGKDTILEPVKQAIGPWNFAEASPKQVLGRFNGFLKSVILRVNEARDLGEFDRYAFFDHMKAFTAAPPDVLRVDEKHLKEHYVPNLCGVIITTNHKTDGIYLPADDRRHMVAWSNLTKSDFSEDYWRTLYGWYANGGNECVADYLATLDITGFDPKAPPPKTQAFWEIVNANRAPEDAELADVLDDLRQPDIVTVDQVASRATLVQPAFAEWLRDRKNRRSIPHRFEDCGYVAVSNPNDAGGRWKIGGVRHTLYGKTALTVRNRLAAALRFAGAR